MRNYPLLAPLLLVGAMTATVIAQNTGPATPGQPAQPAAPQPRRPLKVGVVDIGVLFREYRRKDTLEQQVNVEREAVKKDLDTGADRVRKMREALDKSPFVAGSEQWMRQRDEIRLAQNSLEYESERRQAGLKKRVEELTLTILTEIEFTIDAYGARNAYDLILKSDKGAADPNDQSELTAQFQERIFRAQISDVLFHSDGIEITDAVKRELNSDAGIKGAEDRARAAQQPKPPGAPPAPPSVPACSTTTPPAPPQANGG
jgi:Skp family chaperone for outer membrane proteins